MGHAEHVGGPWDALRQAAVRCKGDAARMVAEFEAHAGRCAECMDNEHNRDGRCARGKDLADQAAATSIAFGDIADLLNEIDLDGLFYAAGWKSDEGVR